jgi:hypothetical protein
MTAHLKAGWTYSEFNGAIGGWGLDRGEIRAVVCRESRKAKDWQAFVLRFDDGAELYSGTFGTRDEAMGAAVAALDADTTAHAAKSLPLASPFPIFQ